MLRSWLKASGERGRIFKSKSGEKVIAINQEEPGLKNITQSPLQTTSHRELTVTDNTNTMAVVEEYDDTQASGRLQTWAQQSLEDRKERELSHFRKRKEFDHCLTQAAGCLQIADPVIEIGLRR